MTIIWIPVVGVNNLRLDSPHHSLLSLLSLFVFQNCKITNNPHGFHEKTAMSAKCLISSLILRTSKKSSVSNIEISEVKVPKYEAKAP